MRYFRRGRYPNATVGIFLLLLLLIIVSPNGLARFASDIFPSFVYSGVPCAWLRRADNRANHQSILGRGVDNPFELNVTASPLPAEASGFLTIQIELRNNSLGTVPIVYNNQTVVIGDNNTSGLGLIFTPANSLSGAFPRGPEPQSFPERDIRLLGPRQSCIHDVQIPGGNVLVDPALTNGTAQVYAFYRGISRGVAVPLTPAAFATPIYADQGLWTGFAQSEPVRIQLPVQNTTG
jgi:hypothetical protein